MKKIVIVICTAVSSVSLLILYVINPKTLVEGIWFEKLLRSSIFFSFLVIAFVLSRRSK